MVYLLQYMIYLVQYIWYIWYRLSGTALKYIAYLVQYISIFHIYGIFGTVYQYIWYRLSSTALKYMVYLVQYISIFHWIRFNVMPGTTGCVCPLQASSNGTSESRPLNGER